jgi:hypothetical protein
VRSKGLCDTCYQRELYRERPELIKPSLLIDQTAYLEEVTARDRAWFEQRYQEQLARKRPANKKRRAAMRARLRQ